MRTEQKVADVSGQHYFIYKSVRKQKNGKIALAIDEIGQKNMRTWRNLVAAIDLGSISEHCAGSSPVVRTT